MDDLSHTINYSLLCSVLRESFNDKTPPLETLESLSARIFDALLLHSDSSVVAFLKEAHLRVLQPKAPLNCGAIGVESIATTSSGLSWDVGYVKQFCDDLDCSTIIGVNLCEREEKQTVRVNLSVQRPDCGLEHGNWVDFRTLIRKLHESIGKTSYLTLEALASHIAVETLRHLWNPSSSQPPPLVTVQAAKPSAMVFASSSEVKIHRTFADYPEEFGSTRDGRSVHPEITYLHICTNAPPKDPTSDPLVHTVALALGSNLGDRFYNIELALRLLETPRELLQAEGTNATVSVANTSFLYESAPMYVTDQPSFINCACMIETNLAPLLLLKLLKTIETTVGRVPSIRNGPRAVDLDIILYDDAVIDTRSSSRKEADDLEGELLVPHPRMTEREFVLRPLHDITPDFVHPVLHQTVSSLLAALEAPVDSVPMKKVIPFPQCPPPSNYLFPHTSVEVVPPTLTHWTFPCSPVSKPMLGPFSPSKTHVMATLNTTPDSFSDGATHNTLPTALAYAQDAVAAGATILDVGGYSTRPGAASISIEEEIDRVVPSITTIRAGGGDADGRLQALPISVDTCRPEVARAAILAGANCINDVYAFTGQNSYPYPGSVDERGKQDTCMKEMKRIAREFAVPVVLMHSRGDAGRNKDYGAYEYAGTGQTVLEGVRVELGEKVDLIVKGKGGVRRWSVIVDPGVGFSKTLGGNLEVLRNAAVITADVNVGKGSNKQRNLLLGYPQLIGASRKSFLGVILEQNGGRKTEPKERGWATAAAVACAVQQGAAVVRVHDTHEMADVVQVANALWK
ncbi:Dihydropteroate synthase-like protein [Mycena sp. CBHHK59/15]|nr:Dihydropteroate synthase-like protein [Mycena sp. CBHHK59/15]